jgi:hypothetical protein
MSAYTMLSTADLRALKDAATNPFAPGVDWRSDALQRLQARGLVYSVRLCAINGNFDVTEAGFELIERAGIRTHRPRPIFYDTPFPLMKVA